MGGIPFLVMLIGFAAVVFWYLKNLNQKSDGSEGLFALKNDLSENKSLDGQKPKSKLKRAQKPVNDRSNWRHKSNLKSYRKLEDD